jgi:hypothetical protein
LVLKNTPGPSPHEVVRCSCQGGPGEIFPGEYSASMCGLNMGMRSLKCGLVFR